MHLTNYAINKDSDNFVFNEDESKTNIGHKRSMTSVIDQIASELQALGHTITFESIWEDTKDVITKTLIVGQPHLQHIYRTSKADDVESALCF